MRDRDSLIFEYLLQCVSLYRNLINFAVGIVFPKTSRVCGLPVVDSEPPGRDVNHFLHTGCRCCMPVFDMRFFALAP